MEVKKINDFCMLYVFKTIVVFFFMFLYAFIPAQSKPDSLRELIKKAKDDKEKVVLLNRLVKELIKTDPVQGLKVADEELQKATQLKSEIAVSDALFNIGLANDYLGNYDTALAFHNRGLVIRQKLNDKKRLSESYNNIGIIYHLRGDYSEALKYYEKTMTLAIELNDKDDAAKVLNNMGSLYERKGNFNKALESYIKALTLNEETGNRHQAALTIQNLGLLQYNQNNFDRAVGYYLKAIKIQEEIGDNRGLANTFNNLAGVYMARKDLDSARYWFNRTYEICNKINDKYGIARVKVNLGSLQFKKGNYNESIRLFNEALVLREAMKDKEGMAFIYKNIGLAYSMLGKFALAEEYHMKALHIAREVNSKLMIKDIYTNLSEIYVKRKDYFNAYEYIVRYSQLKDSIYSDESAKQMEEMNARYETEKKDKELIKKDAEIVTQTAQAEKQNLQRNAFLIGFVMLAVLAVFIFRGYRQKQKANIVITAQKEEVEKKNILIEEQKHLVEEKQKEIVDSINYAKRIQFSLLANLELINKHVPENFVWFRPKDIVSGDFYWATEHENKFYLAVCDSTGHGVPGAFMSLLIMGFLSEAVKEKNIAEPHRVFTYVRNRLINTISKEGQRDGMDGILICVDKKNKTVTYAAAHNSPVLVSEGQYTELDVDKMPVGAGERMNDFKLFTVEYKTKDMLFLYTDGYADQFGGPKGKKFKYKPLNEMLASNSGQSPQKQSDNLEAAFKNWQQELEQVDDVCIIGLRL